MEGKSLYLVWSIAANRGGQDAGAGQTNFEGIGKESC